MSGTDVRVERGPGWVEVTVLISGTGANMTDEEALIEAAKIARRLAGRGK